MVKVPWTSWYCTIPFVGVCLSFAVYGEYQSQVTGTEYALGLPPLWDAVHKNLPDMSAYEALNTVLALLVTVRFLSLGQDFQQFLFLIGLALACRTVSMLVTTQPTCTPQCFQTGGSFPWNTCYDYVYSGHTVVITIAVIAILKDRGPHWLEKMLWGLYAPCCALWISMTRQHYTDDVVLGLLVGSLMSV